ncbi:non-heme iron oxygenase ferredoxin subunit [soil metagenome]
MSWLYACPLEDIDDPGALHLDLDGIPVAVVRSDGEVHAIHDVCSHAEVALSEGDVDGTTIECWMHGSCFDLRSGKPTGPPATVAVPVYPVRVDRGEIFIDPNTELNMTEEN